MFKPVAAASVALYLIVATLFSAMVLAGRVNRTATESGFIAGLIVTVIYLILVVHFELSIPGVPPRAAGIFGAIAHFVVAYISHRAVPEVNEESADL